MLCYENGKFKWLGIFYDIKILNQNKQQWQIYFVFWLNFEVF